MLRHLFSIILVQLAFSCPAQKLPTLGMVSTLENDSLLYSSGFSLLGVSVSSLISPSLTDEEFNSNLEKVKAAKCSVIMCNILFPGTLKIAGPEVDDKKVLDYLNKVLTRAQKANVKNLILGSGGARRLPDGYSPEQAKKEFTVLAGKMANEAKKFGVTIILENLNSSETNFLNTVREAASVVRAVNHPNFRLNTDIYHMMKENESPDEIIAAGKLIAYCEIAEKDQRTLPGVSGDDFGPYLKALKKIKYLGPILIEGRSDNLNEDVPKAYRMLTSQLAKAYR